MSPDQRTAIICSLISLVGGYLIYRVELKSRLDTRRWDSVQNLIQSNAVDSATRPHTVHRIERLESALSKLSEIVAEIGLQQARHMGYHERRDENEPGLLG